MYKTAFAFFALLTVVSIPSSGLCDCYDDSRMTKRTENFTVVGNSLKIDVDVDYAVIKVRKSVKNDVCGVDLTWNADQCSVDAKCFDTGHALRIAVDECSHKSIFRRCRDRDTTCQPDATIVIEVPDGPDIDLSITAGASETICMLGGVSLESFSLYIKAGEVLVDFDAPNPIECTDFTVHSLAGETTLRNLGNARFSHADIKGTVGELTVDFTGETIVDSTARIKNTIGQTTIIVPKEVGVKMNLSRIPLLSHVSKSCEFTDSHGGRRSERYGSCSRKLALTVSTGIGELDLRAEGINTCSQ